MKKLIALILLAALPLYALAENAGLWLLHDGFFWGMSREEIGVLTSEAGETAERATEQTMVLSGTALGGISADVICCLKEDKLYMISFDMLDEEDAGALDAWLDVLTQRYGEPEGEDAVAAASVLSANANMTGGELDFDALLSGMSSVSTWRPEEHTLVALFQFDEDEVCAFAADERVIYDMDENGHIKEFGK